MDRLKYEIMSNFIFQQQCQYMWISEFGGSGEGCLIRQSVGNYIAAPAELIESNFARNISALNVNVSFASNFAASAMLTEPVRHHGQLKSGQGLPDVPTRKHRHSPSRWSADSDLAQHGVSGRSTETSMRCCDRF